jgi:hypothetical protein
MIHCSLDRYTSSLKIYQMTRKYKINQFFEARKKKVLKQIVSRTQ